jgi:signal transduction histidine kinase
MRERALLAGGRLNVISQDGGPTSVAAVLPLPS